MPHRRLLAAAAALSMVAASALPAVAQDEERPHGPPSATPNPVPLDTPAGDGTGVRLTTDLGDIVIGLFNDSAPVAAENFYNLAVEGFYDDVGFHRVASLPGYIVQGGDPEGNGTGGPDYRIVDEEVVGQYGRGIVAMARTSQPDSQGSQFFFVVDDEAQRALEAARTYVIIGRVTEGMDVVDAIVETSGDGDLIEDPVRILSTSIEEVELPPEPTPAPPTPAEAAVDELAALMPASAGGYDLAQATYTLEEVGAQFDRDIIAELQAIADEAGGDLGLMAIAQASGQDNDGFASIAAASIPGVDAASVLDPIARLLLPGANFSAATEETFGERTATLIETSSGQKVYAFPSGDVVWFVTTSVDDVESMITALP